MKWRQPSAGSVDRSLIRYSATLFMKLASRYHLQEPSSPTSQQSRHQSGMFLVIGLCETAGIPSTMLMLKIYGPTNRKPLPLTTVELQKNGSKYLSMSSDEIMKVGVTMNLWISLT